MEYVENKELEEKEIKGMFKDMMKYAPSKLCGMFGNMITLPIYTSLFTHEQYGLYTISIAMLSFLCIIFSDWVGLAGLRFFRHHQLVNDLPKYMTTLVAILTINMLLMFSLALIFKDPMYSLFNVPFKYYIGVLFLIIPVAIRALLSQILRAQLKSVSYTVATILNQFATIGLTYVLAKVFHNLGAASILISMAISITAIDIMLLYMSEVHKIFKLQKIEWKIIMPIVKYGIPVAATSLSAWIITQSNKLIMQIMSENHEFTGSGIVGAGYQLTLPILMPLFAMITVAAIPRIYNMYEAKVDVRPIITRIMGYYILLAIPVITVMSLYNIDLTHLLVKKVELHDASLLVPFFSYGVFFLGLTDYTTLQYHLANKTHIDFIIKLISGIVGVILNIVLIPKMGIVGVGIATFAANALYCLLSMIIVLPGLNLYVPKRTILYIILAGIPSAGIYYLFTQYAQGVSGAIQMCGLLTIFYVVYFGIKKLVVKFS